MKKLLLLAPLLLLGSSLQAQTNGPTIWDYLTTGSNYWVAPFSTFSTGDKSFGGGIALGYLATEAINPVLRLDYFAGQAFMVSGNLQLQPPRRLLGKFPVVPFGIAGVGTPFSGSGATGVAPGTAIGIVGAGAALKLDFLSSNTNSFLRRLDLVGDYEHWAGMTDKQKNQIRFGVLFKF